MHRPVAQHSGPRPERPDAGHGLESNRRPPRNGPQPPGGASPSGGRAGTQNREGLTQNGQAICSTRQNDGVATAAGMGATAAHWQTQIGSKEETPGGDAIPPLISPGRVATPHAHQKEERAEIRGTRPSLTPLCCPLPANTPPFPRAVPHHIPLDREGPLRTEWGLLLTAHTCYVVFSRA